MLSPSPHASVPSIASTKNRLTHPPPARRGAPSPPLLPTGLKAHAVSVCMRGRACQPLPQELPGQRTHRGAVGEAREGGGGGGEGAGGAGKGQNDSGLREHSRERNDGFVATFQKLPDTPKTLRVGRPFHMKVGSEWW